MIIQEYSVFLLTALIFILYAEIHYRFPFFPFSRYFIREPEIIVDIPHRVEPNHPLPILLLIKDSHRYPIRLRSIHIRISSPSGYRQELVFKKDININSAWWYEIIKFDNADFSGNCTIHPIVTYEVKGKLKQCSSHNFKNFANQPLKTFFAKDFLPGNGNNWCWGDIHYHSILTDDFVEFGAPLDATQEAASALGLKFVCITDHSYDLDDIPGSWKNSDPDLNKWYNSRKKIEELNTNSNSLLIPSEEVTSENNSGRNVHTLVINNPEYIPGSGDGAEKWFQNRTEQTTKDILNLLSQDSLAIAAHPGVSYSFSERLLLNRGMWEKEDYDLPGVAGFQILNGNFSDDFNNGLKEWIRVLLEGEKKFIYAGNDAHGNFNIFRQIKHAMWNLWEHHDQIFGKCRTGIMIQSTPTIKSIIDALKKGKCVVSNGPLLEIKIITCTSSYTLGDSVYDSNIEIYLNSHSTEEFGQLKELTLYWGDLNDKKESKLKSVNFDKLTYINSNSLNFSAESRTGYIRGKLVTSDYDGNQYYCYTNPIWINK